MLKLCPASAPTSALHILRTLEARDPGVFAHGLRVGAYARRLALRLGLDGPDLDLLEMAGRVHDLGKLGVPPFLVHKDGPLTPSEQALLRRHPALGAAMLEAHRQPEELVLTARHHHEHWDGSGYPFGLAGHEIPLFARITAVADAYDAMTSHRPYRPLWSEDQALDELEACAGTQFCPEMVFAFRAAAREGWALQAG